MSGQRYAPELKAEAVRQVLDQADGVASVAPQLGVSANTLHRRVRDVKPDKTHEQANELIDAKSEVLKLRAQLRRVEEERDVSKKGRSALCQGARVK